MKHKAVIFDMDGTVLDTLSDLENAVNKTLSAFGLPICSHEQVRCYVGNGALRLIQQAAPHSSETQIQALLDYFKDYYGKNCELSTAPYQGITELLAGLRAAGLKLAVVSNKPHFAVVELAEKFFPGLFDVALGQSDGIPRKPAPDMVELAMDKMGVEKAESVYIGDSEVDVFTAKNTGIDCISVTWGFRTIAELEENGAYLFAHSTKELEDLLVSEN